jgi:ligand-binding SRPBCC domain-containing protein
VQLSESVLIRRPPEEVFRFCLSLAGFKAQFPLPLRLLACDHEWSIGSVVDFKFKFWGIWLRYAAEVTAVDRNRSFVDVMRRGPYKYRTHEHRFEAVPEGTLYTDVVDFSGGLFGLFDRALLGARERATLKQRHGLLKSALEPHAGS